MKERVSDRADGENEKQGEKRKDFAAFFNPILTSFSLLT